jgi:DNA-binding response OmpR family regulator
MRAMQHSSTVGASEIPGMRPDEQGVRLLFVEHSPEYATLVCETLDASTRGHFDVRHAPRLDAAVDDLRRGDYDALLLDFTARDGAAVEKSIESASRLASRLPVILLTGSDDPQESTAPRVEDVRERMARSRLPSAILRAVRRHRRLGQQSASEPIVLRDPLRALAAAFARLRRT